jgi:hypothetical protein
VAGLQLDAQHDFRSDLLAAADLGDKRVLESSIKDKGSVWQKWLGYCTSLGHSPYLPSTDSETKVDIILVFALRYRRDDYNRHGRPREKPIGAHRISTVLNAIAERFTAMGLPDPRQDITGKTHKRLAWLLSYFSKSDPAPDRVWPVTLSILSALLSITETSPTQRKSATFDLCIAAYFFLCRPGEYADAHRQEEQRSTPFRLEDVRFSTLRRSNLPASTCSLNDVKAANFVALTFSDQKNGVKGETIGHGSTTNPKFCPVEAIKRRVLHLREHNAAPDTPLYTIYSTRGASPPTTITTTRDITPLLRAAAATVEHITGIPPAKIQAYSLRSGGATALLCAGTNPILIQLIGRWKSKAMLLYLRTMATALTAPLAQQMLDHGSYTFIPSSTPTVTCLHPADIPVLDDDGDTTELERALD